MTRSKHLQWCKDRALNQLDTEGTTPAFTSFMSDMTKHEETKNHLALEIGMTLKLSGLMNVDKDVREWIEGFN